MSIRAAIVFAFSLPIQLWTAPLFAADTVLEPPRITVAEPLGAWQLRPDEPGARLALADTAGAAAVAVDPDRQLTWLRTGEGLRAFDRDGEPAGGFPLALPPGTPQLAVMPEDGSLWLADGTSLRAYGSGGLLLHDQTLTSAVVDLALDAERRVLWTVAADGTVAAFDAVAGVPLSPLVAPEAAATAAALAVDPLSGELWVGHATGLQRLGQDGRLLTEVPAEASVSRLAAAVVEEALVGVWAVAGEQVLFLSPEGDVYFDFRPFPEGRGVTALAIDPASGAAWISDGRQVVELTTAGEELLHDDLGEAGNVLALGVLRPEREARPPSLEILQPTEGEATSERRPAIVVRVTAGDARVVPETLELALGGFPLDVECETTAELTTCRPAADLPFGALLLSATVADADGQRSEPAVVSFGIREAQPASVPEEPANDPPTGIPPTYTPVVSPRGLRPDTPFVVPSGLDYVDASSGNLTITLPLGQTYTVGPLLSYRFQVVYNSNVWEHHEVACQLSPGGECGSGVKPGILALTNPQSNAGLGWELHFGKLYAPIPPTGMLPDQLLRWPNRDGGPHDGLSRWMYVAPDGGVRYFYLLSGRPSGNAARPIRYTKDGTFMRLRQTSANVVLIESPDGLVSEFRRTDETEGTNFCGDGASGCWRFYETRDGYGNRMWIDYSTPASTTKEVWDVHDSTGRSHQIVFQRGNTFTGGGDCGSGEFCTPPGNNEWGDLRRVVRTVRLASFGNTTAEYGFTTELKRITRGCPSDSGSFPGFPDSIRLPILREITVPGSQPYEIDSFLPSPPSEGGGCVPGSGQVTALTTPSQGKIAYQYAWDWEVPTRCTYHTDPEATYSTPRMGISRRKSYAPDGTLLGTWKYSSTLEPSNPGDLYGDNCRRADYRVSTVDAPADGDGTYTRTKFYYSVHQGPRHPLATTPIGEWQVTDEGLPFSKHESIGSGDEDYAFLSQQTYHCGASCQLKRSTYLRYASEYRGCNKAGGDSADCYKANPLRVRERVVYEDDLDVWVETAQVRYDGAGHFRKTSVRDRFAVTSTSERIETTQWNATSVERGIDPVTGYVAVGNPSNYLPGPEAPWILETYSEKRTVADGRTYVTEYAFDAKGQLRCSRRWKGAERGPEDLVVELVRGTQAGTDAGLPVREVVAGGEGAALPLDSVCSEGSGQASNGTRYELRHEYQSSALSRTFLSGFPDWYRADVDRNTALPSATYNAAGQRTAHTFDALGRLTRSEPEASLGEASTAIVYHNPAQANPWIEEQRLDGAAVLTWHKSVYDGFGRLLEERQRRPTGASGWTESQRQRWYDKAGYLRGETTWHPVGANPVYSTTYTSYDAFGRVGQIKAPDGAIERRTYGGERRVVSTVEVRTSLSGTSTAVTTTVKDPQGQVIKVHAPQHDTSYTYDPYGQQVAAERRSLGSPVQVQRREYGYDARGLLLSERHPESGLNGNGWITYHPDAFGQPRWLRDGEHDLTYVYDDGGRLVLVKETGGRLLKEWTWGTANAGNDYRKGKVVTAKRHNYPLDDTVDWLVVDQYEYRGVSGQPSLRKTHLEFPWVGQSGPTFSQGYTYDRLGNPTQLTYPACAAAACNGTDDQPAPAHTVTTSYNQGMVWKVASSRGPWGEAAYHPNFQLAQLDYSNNVQGVFDQGTNGMTRPRRLRYRYNRDDSLIRFGTGFYEYDAAGNVWQIGNDRYLYDTNGRLTYGKVSQGLGSPVETYAYDAFDNILSVTQTGAGTIPYSTSPVSNRYLGGENEIRYDGAGNLLEIGVAEGGGPLWEMQYDALNMQRRFISNDVPVSDYLYAYDANDHRLLTFNWYTGDLRYHFRDLGGRILRELRVQGSGPVNAWNSWSHQKDYVYGPLGLLATVSRDGEEHFYHQDHLGTPRAITDHNGVRRGRYDYFPFGQEILRANQLDDWNVKFTGHQRDPHGLADYMMARTCLWPLRRFASVDPGREGWNLYAYAQNNPIGRIDPDGRESRVAQMVDLGNREILAGGEAYFQDEGLQAIVATAVIAIPGPEDVAIGAVGAAVVGARAVAAARGGGLLARAGNFLRKIFGKADDVKVPEARGSTLSPGPYAKESIPARGPARDFTPAERKAINEAGNKHGCHTCGTKEPGTKSGDFVPDHQPPNALNPQQQQLYPHCLSCSRRQGGELRSLQR